MFLLAFIGFDLSSSAFDRFRGVIPPPSASSLGNPMLFLRFNTTSWTSTEEFPPSSDHTFYLLPSCEIWLVSSNYKKIQSQIHRVEETFNVIKQKENLPPQPHPPNQRSAHTKNTSTHGKTPMATQAQATKEKQQASNKPCNGPCKSCQEIEWRTTATRRWHDHIYLACLNERNFSRGFWDSVDAFFCWKEVDEVGVFLLGGLVGGSFSWFIFRVS